MAVTGSKNTKTKQGWMHLLGPLSGRIKSSIRAYNRAWLGYNITVDSHSFVIVSLGINIFNTHNANFEIQGEITLANRLYTKWAIENKSSFDDRKPNPTSPSSFSSCYKVQKRKRWRHLLSRRTSCWSLRIGIGECRSLCKIYERHSEEKHRLRWQYPVVWMVDNLSIVKVFDAENAYGNKQRGRAPFVGKIRSIRTWLHLVFPFGVDFGRAKATVDSAVITQAVLRSIKKWLGVLAFEIVLISLLHACVNNV